MKHDIVNTSTDKCLSMCVCTCLRLGVCVCVYMAARSRVWEIMKHQ